MNPRRKKRLILLVVMVLGIGVATGLALQAFNENLMFFFSPTQVVAGEAPDNHTFRMGGLVVPGSIKREEGDINVRFDLTDSDKSVTVHYGGILPDLFREGQGIVVKGRLGGSKGGFIAEEVLAKHDENYMPPEVADVIAGAHDDGEQ